MESCGDVDRGRIERASSQHRGFSTFNFPDLFDLLARKLCLNDKDPTLSVEEFVSAVMDIYLPLQPGPLSR